MKVDQINSRLRALLVGLTVSFLAACGGGDLQSEEASTSDEPAERELTQAITPARAALARWSDPINLSIVPVAGSMLPNGKVLFWSSESRLNYYQGSGQTYTSLFQSSLNPSTGVATGSATEALVNETGHDMFCPGTTNLADGRILVNGGIDATKTSIYDPASNSWAAAAPMSILRGYNANTILADGSVLTLGGSWDSALPIGGKDGEVWSEAGGWRRLWGVSMDTMWAGVDPDTLFANDSHMWLIPTGNGLVLNAGPNVNMSWINTEGNGSVAPPAAAATTTSASTATP